MEKIYKTRNSAGASDIVVGILVIVFGITLGTISIVSGGKLLKSRSNILF